MAEGLRGTVDWKYIKPFVWMLVSACQSVFYVVRRITETIIQKDLALHVISLRVYFSMGYSSLFTVLLRTGLMML